MRIINDSAAVDIADRGATVALGNFDGVHRGHQHVIARAHEALPEAPLGVVTFVPHPRRFFKPDAPAFELMTPETRARRLARIGVERLYQLRFDQDLARLSPQAFCEDVLARGLGIAHVTVGADFCFGAQRAGTAETLQQEGARLGFGVTIVPLVEEAAIEVSSTAIRQALLDGKPELAAAMFGHWHRIEGTVLHGEKRGRELGYPTANMALDGILAPCFGVYAVRVDVLDGPHAGTFDGVASLGVRPMFGENKPNLEVNLFDFSGDLYGATLSVALVAWQRPEEKFDSLAELIAQMDSDAAEARARLRAAFAA
jgi:riboflavin kinase/FMN adenylyltransferase